MEPFEKSFKRLSWEEDKGENPVIKERDNTRKRASDLQKKTAEVQAARYETTIYRLMERSGDNSDLVNALNDFSCILHGRSFHGVNDQPLTSTQVERLTRFFEDKSKELNSLYL